jgi:CBS domain-containing protein/anti-sigma regulatory factor (Ser/Thr protein kinase)
LKIILGDMSTQEITKVQELIYTTRVESVMAPNVIAIDPSSSMGQVKDLMRDKHISGAPVVRGKQVIGIVTIRDVIRSMEEGKLDFLVTDLMTTDVRTVSKDSIVTDVVKNLGQQGFSRLPVVDQNGDLVGIVTTGTLIRSLLKQMDKSFQRKEAEKLYTYRASHIFQDISSDDTSLLLRFFVNERDFDNAGKASSLIKRSLQRLMLRPQIVRRVGVAVYEAEMNLVIHTDIGGEITVEVRKDRVNISTVDHGPGIGDLKQVLQPGFSTAPEWIRDMGFGAGMGLANIRRVSDVMKLTSAPGQGTRLEIVFNFLNESLDNT